MLLAPPISGHGQHECFIAHSIEPPILFAIIVKASDSACIDDMHSVTRDPGFTRVVFLWPRIRNAEIITVVLKRGQSCLSSIGRQEKRLAMSQKY